MSVSFLSLISNPFALSCIIPYMDESLIRWLLADPCITNAEAVRFADISDTAAPRVRPGKRSPLGADAHVNNVFSVRSTRHAAFSRSPCDYRRTADGCNSPRMSGTGGSLAYRI